MNCSQTLQILQRPEFQNTINIKTFFGYAVQKRISFVVQTLTVE